MYLPGSFLRTTKTLLLFVGIFLFCPVSQAQEFSFPAHKKRVSIPFRFIKNLIIVPLNIDGKGPFNFVLDTGVGFMLISDYALAERLGLENLRSIKVAGWGERDEVEAFITPGLGVTVGEVVSSNLHAAILKKDAFNLSEYAGLPIHGLLGYEFFASFIVRISYNNQTLTLYPIKSSYIPRKGNKINLSIEERKPYLQARLILGDEKERTVKLVMDTGSGQPLSLESENGVPFPIPDINIAENLGVGLGGPIKGYLGRTSSLSLGKFELKRVITAFPDYNDTKTLVPGRNGSLGNAVLKHFEMVIDYSRSALYIKPSVYFKEGFKHDMSGISFVCPSPNYNRLLVAQVAPGSPADLVGLVAGDEVMSINLKPVSSMTMDDIDGQFNSEEDRSFLLEILSAGNKKTKKIILTLKKRI